MNNININKLILMTTIKMTQDEEYQLYLSELNYYFYTSPFVLFMINNNQYTFIKLNKLYELLILDIIDYKSKDSDYITFKGVYYYCKNIKELAFQYWHKAIHDKNNLAMYFMALYWKDKNNDLKYKNYILMAREYNNSQAYLTILPSENDTIMVNFKKAYELGNLNAISCMIDNIIPLAFNYKGSLYYDELKLICSVQLDDKDMHDILQAKLRKLLTAKVDTNGYISYPHDNYYLGSTFNEIPLLPLPVGSPSIVLQKQSHLKYYSMIRVYDGTKPKSAIYDLTYQYYQGLTDTIPNIRILTHDYRSGRGLEPIAQKPILVSKIQYTYPAPVPYNPYNSYYPPPCTNVYIPQIVAWKQELNTKINTHPDIMQSIIFMLYHL